VKIGHVPRGVDNEAQGFGLKALEDLDVGRGRRTPELNAVGPDGFTWINEFDIPNLQSTVSVYAV
jgi:hypothetical protein